METYSYQAFQIAHNINSKLTQIHDLLKYFDRGSTLSPYATLEILASLKNKMPEIHKLLKDSFNKSETAAANALKTKFSFSKFHSQAGLSVILAYTYIMVSAIQNQTGYTLIEDQAHMAYASRLMEFHEPEFKNYVRK